MAEQSKHWYPEKNTYSPPTDVEGVKCFEFDLSSHDPAISKVVGRVIGVGGQNLIHLTRDNNLLYIWYKDSSELEKGTSGPGVFELWGMNPTNLEAAKDQLGLLCDKMLTTHLRRHPEDFPDISYEDDSCAWQADTSCLAFADGEMVSSNYVGALRWGMFSIKLMNWETTLARCRRRMEWHALDDSIRSAVASTAAAAIAAR